MSARTTLPRLAAAALAVFATSAHAALYYLKSPPSATNDWNAVANWTLNPDGTGGSPASMAGHSFDLNNRGVNTPSSATTFGGVSLKLNGGAVALRAGTTSTIVAAIGTGGTKLASYDTSGRTLVVTNFNCASGTTVLQSNGGNSAIMTTYHFVTLTGTGNLAVATSQSGYSNTKTIVLKVTQGANFAGDVVWGDSYSESLQFGAGTVFGGGLVVPSTGRITLNQDVTFKRVSLGGTALTPGTYSFATLNAAYDAIFNEGGSGSITVVTPPPMGTTLLLK